MKKKPYVKQLTLIKYKMFKMEKLAYIFLLKLDTRVKCMFVRFFSITTLFKFSEKFNILAGKI